MDITVRDYRLDDHADAQKLADLYNDFDSAWPGGFTRGVPMTPAYVMERQRRLSRAAILVAEVDDRLVGYCDLEAQAGQHDVAYVDLLGARLAFHGKGVGKALLREAVDRAIALGFREVTLHTWAGNTKAVPLYKKTGFQWVPETDVFMRNFVPALLSSPAGKAFFAHRDWYACQVRDLTVAPDDTRLGSMRVFRYGFRDGDDFLNATVEAASGGITGLETPAWSATCRLEVEEALAGNSCEVTWHISAASGRPAEALLLAEGEPGLDLSLRDRFTLQGERTVKALLHVSPDTAPLPEGVPARRVRTTLLIDGDPVLLETGVPVARPVEVEYGGQGLLAGRPTVARVRLRSRVDRPLLGSLTLEPHPGIACASPVQTVDLPPNSYTEAQFALTGVRPGPLRTRLRFEADGVRADRPIDLRVWSGPAAVLSIEQEYAEAAVIDSPDVRADFALRGGRMLVSSAAVGRPMLEQEIGQVGPPFEGFYPRPPLFPAGCEQAEGGPCLVQTGPGEADGLGIERVVSVVAGSVVRVVHRVRNRGSRPAPASVQVRSEFLNTRSFAAPAPAGIVRHRVAGFGSFPESANDLKPEGADLQESWLASEVDGAVCGLVWEGAADLALPWAMNTALVFDLGTVPPGGLAESPAVYVVAGPGTWQTVRAWWRRLVQAPDVVEDRAPEAAGVLELRPEPAPAIVTDEEAELRLEAISRRAKAAAGPLELSGTGLQVEPRATEVPPVDRSARQTVALRIRGLQGPGAGTVDAAWQTDEKVERFAIPVWRPSAPGCRVEHRVEEAVHVFDNGWMTARIDPGFHGSVVALLRDGVDYLDSSWPTARPREWDNPWHGGIHPTFQHWGFDHRWGSPVASDVVERRGAQGLQWSGLQVAWAPEHRDLGWVRFEIEYLTTAGSNVLAVVTRWRNLTAARMESWGGVGVWTRPGGEATRLAAHWMGDGRRHQRGPGGWPMATTSGRWSAAESADSGDYVLIASADDEYVTSVLHEAGGGRHLFAEGSLAVPPNGTLERVAWVAIGTGMQHAERLAAALQVARALP